MRYPLYIVTLVFLPLVILITAAPAQADYRIEQVTDSNQVEESPHINDRGEIVWSGNIVPCEQISGRCHQIYFSDGDEIRRLSAANTNDNANPQINNNGQVVWDGRDDSAAQDREVYLHDGQSVSQITDNDYTDRLPQINESGDIVWEGSGDFGNSEIFLYNGSTTIQVTPSDDSGYYNRAPQINNSGYVVWEGEATGRRDILLYDGISITQLYSDPDPTPYYLKSPQINNAGQVVWAGSASHLGQGADLEIFFFDGQYVICLTNNDGVDQYPQLNDLGHVVWMGNSSTSSLEIFFYDGNSVRVISDNEYDDLFPSINNRDEVVWRGVTGIYESCVYYFDGASTTPLYCDESNAFFLNRQEINNVGQIVWQGVSTSHPGNRDLFLATPVTGANYGNLHRSVLPSTGSQFLGPLLGLLTAAMGAGLLRVGKK